MRPGWWHTPAQVGWQWPASEQAYDEPKKNAAHVRTVEDVGLQWQKKKAARVMQTGRTKQKLFIFAKVIRAVRFALWLQRAQNWRRGIREVAERWKRATDRIALTEQEMSAEEATGLVNDASAQFQRRPVGVLSCTDFVNLMDKWECAIADSIIRALQHERSQMSVNERDVE